MPQDRAISSDRAKEIDRAVHPDSTRLAERAMTLDSIPDLDRAIQRESTKNEDRAANEDSIAPLERPIGNTHPHTRLRVHSGGWGYETPSPLPTV
jgi:hypothetical protein